MPLGAKQVIIIDSWQWIPYQGELLGVIWAKTQKFRLSFHFGQPEASV